MELPLETRCLLPQQCTCRLRGVLATLRDTQGLSYFSIYLSTNSKSTLNIFALSLQSLFAEALSSSYSASASFCLCASRFHSFSLCGLLFQFFSRAFSSSGFRAVQRSALCRSRRELSHQYFLATFGFDIAENEPPKDV